MDWRDSQRKPLQSSPYNSQSPAMSGRGSQPLIPYRDPGMSQNPRQLLPDSSRGTPYRTPETSPHARQMAPPTNLNPVSDSRPSAQFDIHPSRRGPGNQPAQRPFYRNEAKKPLVGNRPQFDSRQDSPSVGGGGYGSGSSPYTNSPYNREQQSRPSSQSFDYSPSSTTSRNSPSGTNPPAKQRLGFRESPQSRDDSRANRGGPSPRGRGMSRGHKPGGTKSLLLQEDLR